MANIIYVLYQNMESKRVQFGTGATNEKLPYIYVYNDHVLLNNDITKIIKTAKKHQNNIKCQTSKNSQKTSY